MLVIKSDFPETRCQEAVFFSHVIYKILGKSFYFILFYFILFYRFAEKKRWWSHTCVVVNNEFCRTHLYMVVFQLWGLHA